MNFHSIMGIYNFIKQFGLIAIGALIPTVIGYFGTREREKAIIKVNFQMRAAEELINAIKEYLENLHKLDISYSSFLEKFNIAMSSIDKIKESDLDDIEEKASYEDDTVEQIMNISNSYTNLWIKSTEKFANIISILESKEVIFNRFVGFKELLIDEHNQLEEIYNKITNFFYLNIYEDVINKTNVNVDQIKQIKEYETNFEHKAIDMYNYLFDLRVASQNEFFHRLFRYKVPIRIQGEGQVPVYKAGFKFKKYNNIK